VWGHLASDRYLVTGLRRDGKRFKLETASWDHARGINVWQGSQWLLRDGKRFLIQRISN
jgi:hypothetical protein